MVNLKLIEQQHILSLKSQKKQLLNFYKMLQQLFEVLLHIKMGKQKIANLLGDADNESTKLATRKWHVTNDQNNTVYGEGN